MKFKSSKIQLFLGLLSLSIFSVNCSGSTYSKLLEGFDGLKAAVSGSSSSTIKVLSAAAIDNTKVRVEFNSVVSALTSEVIGAYEIKVKTNACSDAAFTTESTCKAGGGMWAEAGQHLAVTAVYRDPSNPAVVYLTTGGQVPNVTYELIVATTVATEAGATLSPSGRTATFTSSSALDTTAPTVVSATSVVYKKVEIVFNEEVMQTSAEATANYKISTNPTCASSDVVINSATRYASNRLKVQLSLASMTNTTYYLQVSNVKNKWGLAMASSPTSCHAIFTGIKDAAPTVTSVISTGGSSNDVYIQVTFSEPINPATASTNDFVVDCAAPLDGNTNNLPPTGFSFSNDNTIIVNVPNSSSWNGSSCKLFVKNPPQAPDTTPIADMVGTPINGGAGNSGGFIYVDNASDTTAPQVSGIVAVSNTVFRVTFTEAMDAATASNISNYSIAGLGVTAVTCSPTSAPTFCDLTTTTQSGQAYAVTVNSQGTMKDANGNLMGSSVSATVTGSALPYVQGVQIINNSTIQVITSAPITCCLSINDVTFSSATNGMAVGNGGKIYKTTDGGTTWFVQPSGGTTADLNSITMNGSNPSAGVAVGAGGTILVTSNGGASWTSANTVPSGIGAINSVTYPDSTNSNILVAVGAGGKVIRSTNGGLTWTTQTVSPTTANNLNQVVFKDANNGWAVGNNGTILYTTNGGVNWTSITPVAPSTGININTVSYVADGANNKLVFGGSGGAIFYGTASTTTPQSPLTGLAPTGTSNDINSISMTSATTGWAVGNGGTILYTTNGGASWTAQTSNTTQNLMSVSAVNSNTAFVSSANGSVFSTTNSGSSWAPTGSIGSGANIANGTVGTSPNNNVITMTINPPMSSTGSYTLGLPLPVVVNGLNGNGLSNTAQGNVNFSGDVAPYVTYASQVAALTVEAAFSEVIVLPTSSTSAFVNALPAVVANFAKIDCGVNDLDIVSVSQSLPNKVSLAISTSSAANVTVGTTCTLRVNTASTPDSTVVDFSAQNATASSPEISFTFQFNTTIPDTLKPQVVSALSVNSNTVTVTFNEPMDNTSGGVADINTLGAYSIAVSGGGAALNVSAVSCASQTTCTLTTDAQSNSNYTVTVTGVQDSPGGNNIDTVSGHNQANFNGTATIPVTAPTVSSVALSPASDPSHLLVTFSEAVDLTTSQLASNYAVSPALGVFSAQRQIDTTKVLLTFNNPASGSGTTYTLTVSNVQDVADGLAVGTPNSGTFNGLNLDTSQPFLLSVSAASTTTVGVVFNENIQTASTSDLYSATNLSNYNLSLGAVSQSLTSITCSTSKTCTITTTSALVDGAYSLTVTNVKDTAGNKIGAPNLLSFTISTAAPPALSYVNSDALDKAFQTYTTGANINLFFNFNEPVTLSGGTMTATLNSGTTVDVATFSNLNSITTIYTVGVGQSSTDLTVTNLALNGSATLKDAQGNTVNVAVPTTNANFWSTKNVVIDAVAPSVTGVTSPTANGTYGISQIIQITVSFNDTVDVSLAGGTPTLTLKTGSTNRVAVYASGTASNTLTFNYTVQVGDNSTDLDYLATTALSLNGGTIKDISGNNAVLTFVAPAANGSIAFSKAIIISTTQPTVSNVTSALANGSYGIATTIDITVTFSQSVTVLGTPYLQVETGTTDQLAFLTGTGSASTTHTFRYVIQKGDASLDLDYKAINSLFLNGGTIKDAFGNGADLTLASPSAVNSLGANKALIINTTTAPTNLDLASVDDTGISSSDDKTNLTSGLSISGSADAGLTVTIYDGATLVATTSADSNGNWSGDIAITGDAVHNITAKEADTAGNLSLVSATLAITLDTVGPTITASTVSQANNYIDVTFSDAISGSASAIAAITTSDLSLAFAQNTGTATAAVMTSVKKNDNTSEAGATALTGGETTVRVFVTVTGAASGAETLTVTPVANSIFESVGNAAANTTTTGAKNLNATGVSNILSGTLAANNAYIDVVFDEGVWGDAAKGSVVSTPDFTLTYTSSGDVVTAVTINAVKKPDAVTSGAATALSGGELTVRLFLTLANGPASGLGKIEINPASSAIFNGVLASGNQVSPTSETTGVKTLNDKAAPTITSAETGDSNNNGKIDYYKITFSEAVKDSTFPGYSANAVGVAQTAWLVAGYAGEKLAHGTAAPTGVTDTANDNTLYITFTEKAGTCSSVSQVSCDTGAKPDLTTTAAPALQDANTNTMAQVATGAVTEADRALPTVMAATGADNTHVTMTFSEAMGSTQAGTVGNYSSTGGLTFSAAVPTTADATKVTLTSSAQSNVSYTVTVATAVLDIANNALNNSAKTATFTGSVSPTVLSAASTGSTSVLLTYSENMVPNTAECGNTASCSSIYSIGGLTVTKVVSSLGAGTTSDKYIMTTTAQVEGTTYTVTVSSPSTVTSSVTGAKVSSTGNTATFTGVGAPAVSLSIDTTTACPANGNKRVVIQFNKAVTVATAQAVTNYSISGCPTADCASGNPQASAASVTYNVAAHKAKVNFATAFDVDGSQYTITVSNVTDATGNVMPITNVTFQCGADTVKPTLISAISQPSTTTSILLTFSEAITSATANTKTNYVFDSSTPDGTGILNVALQLDTRQVLVTSTVALSKGGHNVRVVNIADIAGNIINNNGIDNFAGFLITPPGTFNDGPVFDNPFSDNVLSGQIFIYGGKLYIGPDSTEGKIFEMAADMSVTSTITLDANSGVAGNQTFAALAPSNGGASNWAGATNKGIDYFYSGCIGASPSTLTGTACTNAGGSEMNVAGGYITNTGGFDSIWASVNPTGTTWAYTERFGFETGGNAFRTMAMIVFKDQLYVAFQDQGGGAVKFSRQCVNPAGCFNGDAYLTITKLKGSRMMHIGAGATIANGQNGKLISMDSMWEYDNDGTGTNPSQLYVTNGGSDANIATRTGSTQTDGGIMRTQISVSTTASTPIACTGNCVAANQWQDVTPTNAKWLKYMSIALPEDAVGDGVCSTLTAGSANEDWDCLVPMNKITPAIKAIPYMRTAPNGDLYIIRNACSSATVQPLTTTVKHTCASGSEIPQLWMLAKGTTGAPKGAADWVLVAENGVTGKTNMAGNASCTSGVNRCDTENTHITLLEMNGNFMYIGYDNSAFGVNIWRIDMSGVASGTVLTESNFSLVSVFGLRKIDGTADPTGNTRIFSNVTVNASGTDYVVLTSGNGINPLRVYRNRN